MKRRALSWILPLERGARTMARKPLVATISFAERGAGWLAITSALSYRKSRGVGGLDVANFHPPSLAVKWYFWPGRSSPLWRAWMGEGRGEAKGGERACANILVEEIVLSDWEEASLVGRQSLYHGAYRVNGFGGKGAMRFSSLLTMEEIFQVVVLEHPEDALDALVLDSLQLCPDLLLMWARGFAAPITDRHSARAVPPFPGVPKEALLEVAQADDAGLRLSAIKLLPWAI